MLTTPDVPTADDFISLFSQKFPLIHLLSLVLSASLLPLILSSGYIRLLFLWILHVSSLVFLFFELHFRLYCVLSRRVSLFRSSSPFPLIFRHVFYRSFYLLWLSSRILETRIRKKEEMSATKHFPPSFHVCFDMANFPILVLFVCVMRTIRQKGMKKRRQK